jgi:glycosyltransferase involved in cell wall biosynthesis
VAPSFDKHLPTALGGFGQIPTEDAEAALRFCRGLARIIANSDSSTAERITNSPFDIIDAASSTPEFSLVIPIYNEEENIPVLYSRIVAVLEAEKIDFEIIFVDDGSCDRSTHCLNELQKNDRRVVILELARNFGHQVAITAGLDFANGRAVAVMDGDLQDPPEVLPQFVAKWREGNEVVYAVRAKRKEAWIKRTSYKFFYRLLRHVANIDIPLDAGDFCIMDRRVVDLLQSMPERNRFVRGIRSWVGFKQIGVPFEREARYAGKSKYTFLGLMLLALDGLVSFSYVPLRIITFLGFTVSFISILLAIFYVMVKLQLGLPPGFATIVVAICFFSGVQLITLGVIGEYVGRIFEEAKRRPLYVLRRVSRID